MRSQNSRRSEKSAKNLRNDWPPNDPHKLTSRQENFASCVCHQLRCPAARGSAAATPTRPRPGSAPVPRAGDKRVVKTATHGRLYCRSAGALFLQADSLFALESIDQTLEILLRLRANRNALEVA